MKKFLDLDLNVSTRDVKSVNVSVINTIFWLGVILKNLQNFLKRDPPLVKDLNQC
jgi:hypothetical protein